MTRIICTHVLFPKLVKQTQDIGSANATYRRTPTSSNSIILLIEPGRHRQRCFMRKLTESDLMVLFIEPGNDNYGVGVSQVLGAFLTLHTKTAPDRYRYDGQ
jgi:hypothetical protein